MATLQQQITLNNLTETTLVHFKDGQKLQNTSQLPSGSSHIPKLNVEWRTEKKNKEKEVKIHQELKDNRLDKDGTSVIMSA